jgi:hypothetical protein
LGHGDLNLGVFVDNILEALFSIDCWIGAGLSLEFGCIQGSLTETIFTLLARQFFFWISPNVESKR